VAEVAMDSSPCLANWAAVTRLLKEEGEQVAQHSFLLLPPHPRLFTNALQLPHLSKHLALRLHEAVASKYLHEAQQSLVVFGFLAQQFLAF